MKPMTASGHRAPHVQGPDYSNCRQLSPLGARSAPINTWHSRKRQPVETQTEGQLCILPSWQGPDSFQSVKPCSLEQHELEQAGLSTWWPLLAVQQTQQEVRSTAHFGCGHGLKDASGKRRGLSPTVNMWIVPTKGQCLAALP